MIGPHHGISDEELKALYGHLPTSFRGIRPKNDGDFNAQCLIFEGCYNAIAAMRDTQQAAAFLAVAMEVLEENAASGGWKIPERLAPIAEDCRRARAAKAS